MTREKAIEELQAIKSEYSNRELGELRLMRVEVKALDMAIQALSQEGGYCCRTCKHTRINKDGIWCEESTCQWEQAVTNSAEQELCVEPTQKHVGNALDMRCDDSISRQAAIEAVKQAIYNHDSAIMRLTELPSVTQKIEPQERSDKE